MPWCDECSRWHSPNALQADGTCPTCGGVVAKAGPADAAMAEDAAEPKVPWHFWLLLATAGLYLGWRALQGVAWLIDKI